jgi:hypothetical protein
MGQIRGWKYDAVIGVGGIGKEAKRTSLKGKLTWIGIGAQKSGDAKRPRVTFDRFLYYGETGPNLRSLAPALARRMYDRNVRATTDRRFSAKERLEVQNILNRAKAALSSAARSRNEFLDVSLTSYLPSERPRPFRIGDMTAQLRFTK